MGFRGERSLGKTFPGIREEMAKIKDRIAKLKKEIGGEKKIREEQAESGLKRLRKQLKLLLRYL
jgi:archaellum component FlaC